ncbi:hypothetical protein CgIS1_21325 [Frankia sp. CgS1]|nr:hypothetical protein CgIS1_21325 [Frankia sp. CgIS1]
MRCRTRLLTTTTRLTRELRCRITLLCMTDADDRHRLAVIVVDGLETHSHQRVPSLPSTRSNTRHVVSSAWT